MAETRNPYACGVCNESFSSSVYLVKHVQTYHGARKLLDSKNGIRSNDDIKAQHSFTEYRNEKDDLNRILPKVFGGIAQCTEAKNSLDKKIVFLLLIII